MTTALYYQGCEHPDREKLPNTLSLISVVLIHALLIGMAFWHPAYLQPVLPDSPPRIMEAALITAAPPHQPTELPPGPQQVEAVATPEPMVKPEQAPELLTHKEAETVIRSAPEVPKPPREKKVEEIVKEAPVVNPVDATQSAPETTAPAAVEAQPAETATAIATGIQQQIRAATLNWQSLLQMHLEQRKRYPRRAQMRHQEGVPLVRFTMDRSGQVLSAELIKTSGHGELDKEAIALVKRAAPLPPPPADIQGETLTLTLPIEFFIHH
ncbi:energy transducer TonB [Cellvibrio japonicus]|uniref:Possible energy transducer TonB, C-terminal region n=1 Tax=Cellvibrio japonicus (strain Ueda107) TaxID=498211 RepID=B3PLR3_CELJU|nr:energy transducer TonB [Cellvibrio japonicus]ACE84049.1 possible energy transducer TonB, C-terminal region [Cellvibrio japonicus Ueda107]QEI13044.1 energy transducer TonB [Cellvibrio japonicus]QEI16618.1 energy transducer TonB [Cellvibrio japonicus]QEI20196.1 energy transducer TonB [Cellvibrio japonicus]